jgi:hypothetical protein
MRNASKKTFRDKPAEKLRQVVKFVAPPSPVSIYADAPDANGILGWYQFPVAGHVTNLVIHCDSWDKPEDETKFILEPTGDGVAQHLTVGPEKQVKAEVEVDAGERMQLRTTGDVHGIWVSFLFQVRDAQAIV